MPDQMLATTGRDYPDQQENVPMNAGRIAAPMPPNTIRNITISQLNHGYVVNVGCQTFAIENPSTLIAKLAEYINNPAATEQKWSEGKLF